MIRGYDRRSRPTGYDYVVPSIVGLTDTNGFAGTYSFTNFVYDRADHLVSYLSPALATGVLASNMPAETVTTGYNNLGAPIRLSNANGLLVDATTFTPEGRVASRSLTGSTVGTPLTRNYTWSTATGQLTGSTVIQNGVTLQADVNAYQASGNLASVAHTRSIAGQSHNECFTYDLRGRLATAKATTPGTGCAPGTLDATVNALNATYAVDEIGNQTTSPAGAFTYPVSGVNSIRPHAPTTVGTTNLTYTDAGRVNTAVKAGVTTTYTWNPLGQLATFVKGAVTNNMVYLAGGERLLLKDSTGVHLYLGGMAERHITTASVRNEKRYYTLANTTIAVRSRASATDDRVDYLFGDVRGSTTLTVQRNSTAPKNKWYSPYGATRGTPTVVTATSTSRAYIGQITDTDTTLNYLHNRYQDPNLGIFLSVDPLIQKTGQPYLYANGNPTSLSDPTGLKAYACPNTQKGCNDPADRGLLGSPAVDPGTKGPSSTTVPGTHPSHLPAGCHDATSCTASNVASNPGGSVCSDSFHACTDTTGSDGYHIASLCWWPSRWSMCQAISAYGDYAIAHTVEIGTRYAWDTGQTNAFRHSYWMALISWNYGYDMAIEVGARHEQDTEAANLFTTWDSNADRWNNALGASLAQTVANQRYLSNSGGSTNAHLRI